MNRQFQAIPARDEWVDCADKHFGKGNRAAFFGICPGVLLNVFVPGK